MNRGSIINTFEKTLSICVFRNTLNSDFLIICSPNSLPLASCDLSSPGAHQQNKRGAIKLIIAVVLMKCM